MNDMMVKAIIYIMIFLSATYLAWIIAGFIQKKMKSYEDAYVDGVSKSLDEIFIFMDPRKLFQLNVAITVLFFLFGLLVFKSLYYSIILGVIGFFIPKLYLRRAKNKRHQQFENQFVDALILLSNALKSGLTLVQSIEVLENELEPPISQEFGLVLREYRVGVSFDEALKNLLKRIHSEDLNLMVTAINIVHSIGGNLRDIFDTIAKMVTERHKLELKTSALTAQGRSQALIVGLLPMFLGGVFFIMDPSLILPLLNTTLGNIGIGAILTLQATGYIMIKKIMSIEV
ncbi:MAG: type II secretion system F family protein [Desulfobacteraceae bacterium]|jgi:tight adherence protein B|nr:type II secretion system F family protein [Desulfobacteraceae bacterium]